MYRPLRDSLRGTVKGGQEEIGDMQLRETEYTFLACIRIVMRLTTIATSCFFFYLKICIVEEASTVP